MADGEPNAGQGEDPSGAEGGADKGGKAKEPPPKVAGYSKEQVNDLVEVRLAEDRRKRLQDPEFMANVMDHWAASDEFAAKVKELMGSPGDGKKPTGEELQKELDRARKEWETQNLAPVKQALEAKDERIKRLTEDRLNAGILSTGPEIGLRGALMRPLSEGGQAPIVAMLRHHFAYDEETDGWYLKEGDGFAYSANPKPGRPYKSVREFMLEWAQTDDAKEFLDPQVRQGAGYKGAGSGSGRGGVSLAEFTKMTPREQDKLAEEDKDTYVRLMTEMASTAEAQFRR